MSTISAFECLVRCGGVVVWTAATFEEVVAL
jgi:hypothetical protein